MKAKLIDQNIFDELKLQSLSQEEKTNLLKSFSETVMQAVMLRVAVKLSSDRRNELEKLIELENEEKIGKFLKDNISNLDIIIDEESLKFKHALIEKSKQLDKK